MFTRRASLRYGFAILTVVAALALRWALKPVLHDRFPYLLSFFAAIVLSFYSGVGPSLLALGLGLVTATFLFVGWNGFLHAENLTRVALYLLVGAWAAALGGVFRRSRKRAEDTANRLQVTLNSIGDAVIAMDEAGKVTLLNPNAEQLTGWKQEQAIGRPALEVFKIINEHTRRPAADPTERVLREGAIHGLANHTVLVARDGTERLIEDSAAPIRGADGNVWGAILVFHDVTESRRAERALRESEARFQVMADSAPVMIWMSRPDKQCDWFNQPWLNFVGRPMEKEVGNGWTENVHPEDLAQCLETYQTSFDARRPFKMEYRIRNAAGEYRWLLDHGIPRFSGEGEFLGYIGSCIDIEDRKRDEAARARLAAIVDSSNDAVISKNLEGRILTWNQSAEIIFGHSAAEAVGEHIGIIVPPELLEEEEQILSRIRRGERIAHYETVRLTRDGRRIEVSLTISPIRDGAGRVIAASKIARDITEKKRAEAALLEEKERLRTTLASIGDAVIATDTEGKIAVINPVAAALTGRSEEEALGRPLEEVFVIINEETRQTAENPVRRVLREGKVVGLANHTVLVRKDGMEIPIDDSAAPIADAGGIHGVVLVFRDVTLRRKTEQKIQQLNRDLREADRRKDEFLAMLAHELRNPLAPIVGAISLLKLKGPPDPILVHAREVIDRQAKHMVRLVDDLLDVSRITGGRITLKKSKVELKSVVSNAVEASRDLLESKRQTLSLSLPERPVYLHADVVRLAQVLGNLLNNAAKYTPEAGKISLIAAEDDHWVSIRVRDSGLGIPPEMLSRVFDLFTQVDQSLARSQGGLGIGLTVASRLVELHGGRIEAFSEGSGRGSEFAVTLPKYAGEEEPKAPAGKPAASATQQCRVLVVDDNVDAALVMATLLRHFGHQVNVVHDGIGVLDAVRSFRPQVVLLDIGLPGLHGYEVARLLRQEFRREELLLIAVTGYGQETDRRRSEEAGFDQHLVKPVEPEVIRRLIDEKLCA